MTLTSDLHTSQTEAFIAENPSTVTCLRSSRVPTGTGGFTLSDEGDQGERVIRLLGNSSDKQPVVGTDGAVVAQVWSVIAMPDDDWMVGDRFSIGEKKYEVRVISSNPPWRQRLEVTEHGT